MWTFGSHYISQGYFISHGSFFIEQKDQKTQNTVGPCLASNFRLLKIHSGEVLKKHDWSDVIRVVLYYD